MEELLLGCHVSFTKNQQLLGSVLEASSYGANTFMFYTGAPQNTIRSYLDPNLTEQAFQKMSELGIQKEHIVVHAPYIINLANNESIERYQFAIHFLKEEIHRCEQLGMTKLVLHPGSAVKLERQVGLDNIVNALNEVLTESQTVDICLETMAGKGSELGVTFEEIAYLISHVTCSNKVKVCMDTCHLNDSGYAMEEFDHVLEEFDQKIGLSKLACIHINDSKNGFGSHKDRHENIGLGIIGFDTLLYIVHHQALKNVPKILETPYVSTIENGKDRTYPPYRFEIEMLKMKQRNLNLLTDIRNYYK